MTHKGYGEADGHRVSLHECETCGVEFSLCPPKDVDDPNWNNCTADDCPSYDPNRDMDIVYMTDAEIAREKPVVSIKMLRKRKDAQSPISENTG